MTEQDLATIWDNAPRSGHVAQREHIASAIIAAYQAKLRQGVELPEEIQVGVTEVDWNAFEPVYAFNKDQLLQYGDARAQAGYLRGLKEGAQQYQRKKIDAAFKHIVDNADELGVDLT